MHVLKENAYETGDLTFKEILNHLTNWQLPLTGRINILVTAFKSLRCDTSPSPEHSLIFACPFIMWHFWLEASPGSLAYQFIRKHKHSQIRQEVPEPAVSKGSQSMLTSFTACHWTYLVGKRGVTSAFFTFLLSSHTFCTECLRSCWTLLLLLWFSEMFYFKYRKY